MIILWGVLIKNKGNGVDFPLRGLFSFGGYIMSDKGYCLLLFPVFPLKKRMLILFFFLPKFIFFHCPSNT